MGVVAQALRRVGKLDEARIQGEAAVALLEELLGKTHKSLAPSLNNLAVTYDELDRLDDARKTLERALAIKESEIGPNHVSLSIPLSNLAALERRIGHFDAADALLSRAYDLRVAALGAGHPDVTRILQTKLLDRTSRGLDEEARTLVDDVIARQKARPEAVELAGALGLRCELDRRAGKLESGAAFCAEAVTALGATPDPNRACYVYVYAARVAAARKQHAAAADWLGRAQTALGGVTRDKAVATGYVGWAAAHVALAAGRTEEALELARKARASLADHGKSASYVVGDLEKLQ
jgi:tetratricopeptide (TPR) repeat protein